MTADRLLWAALFPGWWIVLVLIRARSVVNLRKTSLLSVDKGLKNTATPFTMEQEEDEDFFPLEDPVQYSAADEESQSGSYATAAETAETGMKSKSFLH